MIRICAIHTAAACRSMSSFSPVGRFCCCSSCLSLGFLHFALCLFLFPFLLSSLLRSNSDPESHIRHYSPSPLCGACIQFYREKNNKLKTNCSLVDSRRIEHRHRLIFFLCSYHLLYRALFIFSFSLARRSSDPGSLRNQALLPPPHCGTRLHFFIARRPHPFLPSSTRIELRLPAHAARRFQQLIPLIFDFCK